MASIFCSLLVSLVTINSAFTAKIAGFSGMSSGSHYLLIKTVMEELASRGHEVVMVVSSDYTHSRSSEKIPHRIYQVPYKPGFIEDVIVKSIMEKSMIQGMMNLNDFVRVSCECLLNSTELIEDLRNFDLVVYEGVSLCAVLVAELLGIRRVAILSGLPPAGVRALIMIPSPASYVPESLTGFTDKMSFLQRVMNLGAYIMSGVIIESLFVKSMVAFKAKYNITPERSYKEAYSKAELVIIAADFALEFPHPLLPGQIMAGPLTVNKPNPLPPELEDFVHSGGGHNGFIIASFGSYVEKVVQKEKIDVLAAAFGKLKQKVLWKLKNYIPPSLSPNIKVVDWLPQNDLLAHKDIKAFVSHVGQKSLYEAAYHGVPVVAFPLYTDQHSNAKKAEHFGLGIAVNHKTLDAQQLFETIERVMNDPRFKREAMRISGLMKDKPKTPLETAGDWIEYVLRHGGAQHLRPQVFNIPWYQYYLLDVIALIVAVVTLVVMVIRMTCRCLCRLCYKKSGNKTKKE